MAESQTQVKGKPSERQPILSPPTQTLETQPGLAELAPQPTSLFNGGTLESQVALLQRMPRSSQQNYIQQIQRVQGARHVQRLVSALHDADAFSTKPAVAPPASAPIVQPKMTVSEPGDPYEQEADQVAESVMRMTSVPPVAPPADNPDTPDDNVLRTRHYLQKSSDPLGGSAVTPDMERGIHQSLQGGVPLPKSERDFFEPRLGADLSNVKVHTDSQASKSAQDLQAHAYTVGSDIAFAPGKYEPGSSAGRKLMAHELTHVIQQGGAGDLKQQPGAHAQQKVNRCCDAGCRMEELQLKALGQPVNIARKPSAPQAGKVNRCGDAACRTEELQLKALGQPVKIARKPSAPQASKVNRCGDAACRTEELQLKALGQPASIARKPLLSQGGNSRILLNTFPVKSAALESTPPVKTISTPTTILAPQAQLEPAAMLSAAKHRSEPEIVKESTVSQIPEGKSGIESFATPTAELGIGPAIESTASTDIVEKSLGKAESNSDFSAESAIPKFAVPMSEMVTPAKGSEVTLAQLTETGTDLGALIANQQDQNTALQGLPDLSSIPLREAFLATQDHVKHVKSKVTVTAEARHTDIETLPQPHVELNQSEQVPAVSALTHIAPEAAPAMPEAATDIVTTEPKSVLPAAEADASRTEAAVTEATAAVASEEFAPPILESTPLTVSSQFTAKANLDDVPLLAETPEIALPVTQSILTEAATTESRNLYPEESRQIADEKPIVIQRFGIQDLIPDWAKDLLNAMRGDAGTQKGELNNEGNVKGGKIQGDASVKGQEIEGDGAGKGAELQSEQEAKGAELQSAQESKVAELQAEQEVKGAELQSAQESKGTELQAEQEVKGAELQSAQESKGTELQAEQEVKGAELQSAQESKGTELQAEQETKGAELQADAESKAQELDGDFAISEQEAQVQEQQTAQEVEAESATLQTEAESASTQVETKWEGVQTEAESVVSGLDEEADELCSEYQGQAASLLQSCKSLLTGGPRAWLEIKQKAKTAWNALLQKAQPLLEGINQKWQQFSGWVSESVWQPLQEKATQFGEFVSAKAAAAWNWIQNKWAWLGDRWAQAEGWIHERATAAREWITGKAAAAREWITGKAVSAREWIAGKASIAQEWIADKATAAQEWIAGKADSAREWIAGRADSAREWITDKSAMARVWITDKGVAVQAWITGKTTAAQDWIQGKADATVNWFQDTGQGLVSGLSNKARSAVSSISSRGGRIGQWFGGVVSGLISGVESAGNGAVSRVSQALSAGLGFVERAASGAVNFVGNTAQNVVKFIGDKATGAVDYLENTGMGAVNFVETASTNAVTGLEKTGNGVVDFVENAGSNAVTGLEKIGMGAVNLVENGATNAVTGLETVGRYAVTGIENRATATVQFVNSAWDNIQSGWDVLTTGVQKVLGLLQDKASQFGQLINQNIIQPTTELLQDKWTGLKSWITEKLPGLTTCWEVFQEFADAAKQKLEVTFADLFNQRENEAALDDWEDQWDKYRIAELEQEKLNEGPHVLENYQPSTGLGMFDTVYDPKTETLEIVVKCNFNFENNKEMMGMHLLKGLPLEHPDFTWTDAEMKQWKEDYIREVSQAWTGNNKSFYAQDAWWESKQVKVNVSIEESTENPHFNVNVEKIPPGGFEGSWVRAPKNLKDGEIESGTAKLDSEDLTLTNKPGGQQRAAIHEFGHMLGLGDEYAATYGCHHKNQFKDRYGVDVVIGADSRVMSGGDNILPEHNLTLLEAIEEITGVNWGTEPVSNPEPVPPDPADCESVGVTP